MIDSGPTSRIPNLAHFFFFLLLTMFALAVSEAGLIAISHGTAADAVLKDQRLQLYANVSTYVITLAALFVAMPVFWHRPFLAGVAWNWSQVRWWFGLGGLVVGFAAQGLTVFIPTPKDLPMEAVFHNPALIWFMAFFGVVMGPLFEEVMFRGFLLPALAIAVDWIRIPRGVDEVGSVENLIAWRSGTGYSTPALVLSSVVTSVLFALMHAPQLGYTWSAVLLLWCVSMGLCWVRLRTGSVAASTLTHGCYNLSVFITLFIGTGGFRHLDKM